MWVPDSALSLEAAAERGDLVETKSFDAKSSLPRPGKNADLAVDVAAMSTDGGVIVYGLGEDEQERLTRLHPFALQGVRERIDSIVTSSISGPPSVAIHSLPAPGSENDGYVVVDIPASPLAPHQVIVGKDFRFYGRGSTGNRILDEAEVARLYERRKTWAVDREERLRETIAVIADEVRGRPCLHAICNPVPSDLTLWDRVQEGRVREEIFHELRQAARSIDLEFSPRLDGLDWRRRGADSWTADVHGVSRGPVVVNTEGENERIDRKESLKLRCDIDRDGQISLWCPRISERLEGDVGRVPVIFEAVVAGITAQLYAVAQRVYEFAGHRGPIDTGLALTGLEGTVSYRLSRQAAAIPYGAGSYSRTARLVSTDLKDPVALARLHLQPFFDALVFEGWDPFKPR